MHNTKLINLISTFSIDERRSLRKWVKTDFVNKNDDIVKFFEFIDGKKTLTSKTMLKEKAYEYIYPNEHYNDLRMRHLIWMTTEIIDEFIVFISIQKNKGLKDQLLAQYYSNHELYKFANQTIEESIIELEKEKIRNADFHLYQFRMNALYFQINSKNDRSKDFKFQGIVDHTTMFLLIESLKYACITQSLLKIAEIKVDNHLLPATLQLIENPKFLEDTVVRIYYNIYLVITEENEVAFFQFIKDLQHNNHLFAPLDLKDLYLLAINFCVKKSNENKINFTKQAFELYIYAIENAYLLERNEISRFSFTNVVTLGIKLKEYSKTEKFILQFSKLIAKEYQKNTVEFNSAKLFYAKGQNQKALKLLITLELKDILWDLNAKYLFLKILFENKEMKRFSVYLKAFIAFVQRKKNIGYHFTYFTNVGKSLLILKEIHKKPDNYMTFQFDKETPDWEWFNKALKSFSEGDKK